VRAYYNEIDPRAAAWIRELIKEGVITDGEVDERSIEDVLPADLAGFDRCHFFAGLAAWDYALNLAGWGDRPVWTGSCPCQPFSAAGKGEGFADERHLWPAWFHLIEVCRPDTLFGEQVSSKDGTVWLDLVHADLEGTNYTVGTLDIPVCGVGAPHRRQRLFFVADSGVSTGKRNARAVPRTQTEVGSERELDGNLSIGLADGGSTRLVADSGRHESSAGRRDDAEVCRLSETERKPKHGSLVSGGSGEPRIVADSVPAGRPKGWAESGRGSTTGGGESDGLDDAKSSDGRGELETNRTRSRRAGLTGTGSFDELGNTNKPGPQGNQSELLQGRDRIMPTDPGPINGFWSDAEWIYCRDGKHRPVGTVESGPQQMVDGAADDLGLVWSEGRYVISPLIEKGKGRVARLRGYGNAISPWVAKAFIEAVMEGKQ
jgi:DNA (cytosine-5)-methyltransferase 1